MTDAAFAQAAAAAAWTALAVFLVVVSAGLIMGICTIAKVWKKVMQHIEQDEARMEKASKERRDLKW